MSASLAAFERPRPGASNTVCFLLEGIYQIQLFFTFFDKKNLYYEVIGI
jgi:hypothetical protein